MSSIEPDSQLSVWLPRLEVYRKAIDAVPIETVPIETVPIVETTLASTEIPIEKIETHVSPIESVTSLAQDPSSDSGIALGSTESNDEPRPFVAESQSGLEPVRSESSFCETKSHIVHLPIDGILKQIKKSKSFVLGVGSLGASERTSVRSVVTELVARCCMKIDRNGLLVSVRSSPDILLHDSFQNTLVREARWACFGDSKADMKAWHAQLAELPGWKQEFGLIVFDLGDMRFPMMPRIGRLCDGIVVQMLNPSDSRETIQTLKSLQKDRLKILGAWSVELNKRIQAA